MRDVRLKEALVILGKHLSANTQGEPIVRHPFINPARCLKALTKKEMFLNSVLNERNGSR